MKLIAAVDQNWNLGRRGELLFRIPADLKRFRALTSGNVVVMGRKTLQSLPGGKPLPNRDSIVLTRDAMFNAEGAHTAHSVAELFELLRRPAFAGKDVFVIGGAEVYAQLLPYCESALITHVNAVREADCALPDLAAMEYWTVAERSEEQVHEGLSFSYVTYQNTRPVIL
ncbi:MAG TPA: dihydrofolate reductase [Feifaniaceae bacterium]|nr:dihydrofolate reductase [Feifaniaceae bacterium]